MHTDLRDLLPAVEAEAPPLRHTADDILRAARRRRTRSRATWASAAAVLLIGAAVAVPQMTTDVEPMPPAAPAGHITYPTAEWTGNLAQVTIGRLSVAAGHAVTPAYEEAMVTDGVHRLGSGKLASVASVRVYRPGALDPSAYLGGEPLTINGRPGKYVPSVAYDSFSTATQAVIWEYQEDAFALITDLGAMPQGVTRDEMVALAGAVSTTVERPVRLGFRLPYVPTGYTLAMAGEADGRSFLHLIKGTFPRTVGNTGVDPGRANLSVSLEPVEESRFVKCESNTCFRVTPDRRQALLIIDNGVLPTDELRKVVNSATFSAAGFPASEAVGM